MSDSVPTPIGPSPPSKPLRIGIFGGSFNPIHLGHVLLAVTTSQTKHLDKVILVPVYKHAIKKDLLPFEDRVAMCQLAVSSFGPSKDNDSNGNGIVEVSTIEQEVKQSNGPMIQHLKTLYPPQTTKFYWICGDDIFTWITSPKGIETMMEVDGVIIQRRLHKTSSSEEQFYKEPKPNEVTIQSIQEKLPHLNIDFIYGELPHFSSTLVRRAPGHWRSFLPTSVARYLDERPALLKQLNENLVEDAKREEEKEKDDKTVQHVERMKTTNVDNDGHHHIRNDEDYPSPTNLKAIQSDIIASTSPLPTIAPSPIPVDLAISTVMRGLEVVHALQWERGQTALWLSTTAEAENNEKEYSNVDLSCKDNIDNKLKFVRSVTDQALLDSVTLPESQHHSNSNDSQDIVLTTLQNSTLYESTSLAYELRHTSNVWLARDRTIVNTSREKLRKINGAEGWSNRYILVEKFNSRIDVLVSCVIRSFREILGCTAPKAIEGGSEDRTITSSTDLLSKWCHGKEALGRLRAFVCAGSAHAPSIVSSSLGIRRQLSQIIATKERRMERVLLSSSSLQSSSMTADVMMKISTGMGATTQLTASLETLYNMLERITAWEWSLMGCFASSTPLHLVHKLMFQQFSSTSSGSSSSGNTTDTIDFDVALFFETTSSAIDLMLTVVKALAAFGCTGA